MNSLKKLLKHHIFYAVTGIFISIVFALNLAFFIFANINYNNDIKRTHEKLLDMVAHLSIEDPLVIDAYLEHYTHNNQVIITYVDANDTLVFSNDTNQTLTTFEPLYYNDNYVGKISVNYESSTLSETYLLGFLLLNIASILFFIIGTWLFRVFLYKQYRMLNQDIDHITREDVLFKFDEIRDANHLITSSKQEQIKQKQVFEANIRSLAHDIKTPITTALIMAEAVTTNRMDPLEAIKDIEHELKQAAAMMPQFIEIDFKKVSYTQDISSFIKTFVMQYQAVFETKHIKVDTNLEPLLIKIADVDLKRLIEHLLFNAFYYSKPHASIAITVNQALRQLIIKDEGIGMNQDTVNQILTKPFRLEETKSYHKNGTGQGYPIILEIIHRLNASIHIESELNKGTTIEITF
ncbi:MAG: HAMP domain-containing sensor histidine kinase [Acholeplasma sp.]|jgi:signal transduction histidine kinase|nr:HAMP domain-containing sensor histidine kinase [Acholeplasma sp.]